MQKAGLVIQFKYTAPSNPHQNSQVEQKFAMLWERLCAMIEGTPFSSESRGKLWSEAANMATYLDNYYPIEGFQHSSASAFFGKGYKLIINSPKIH